MAFEGCLYRNNDVIVDFNFCHKPAALNCINLVGKIIEL